MGVVVLTDKQATLQIENLQTRTETFEGDMKFCFVTFVLFTSHSSTSSYINR